jgi:hypothetical protein
MNLHAVKNEARSCVHLLVADVALEVLGLLMHHQHFVIIEIPFAVPYLVKEANE